MGRIRTIKPEFFQSQSVGRLKPYARLLFIGIWTLADDAGRTRGALNMLSGMLFPYDRISTRRIEAWLVELEGEGMIARYQVSGTDYIQVSGWREHQRINRPSDSKIPAFTEGSLRAHGGLTEGSLGDRDQGSGKGRDQGSGKGSQTAPRRSGAKPAAILPTGVLDFPTVGSNGRVWPLTQASVDEWTALYPSLDVLAEARKALAWVQAEASRRKTPRGMKRFLVGWLNRATDRGGRAGDGVRGSKTARNKENIQAWLDGSVE